MRRGLVAAAVLLGLGLVAGTRGAPPVPPSDPETRVRPAAAAPAAALPIDSYSFARNPFEYADAVSTAAPRASAAPVEPLKSVAPPAPVRLAGFVSRGGRLRAALVVRGEVTLLAVGDSAEGYTLLAADEEVGVRLKGPDGEIDLPVQ